MTLQNRSEAVSFLKKFIDETLDGETEKLKDYDFQELSGSDVFGCPGRPFDCDNTNLAIAIYMILWSEVFPDCHAGSIGTGKIYRGDTLNTFHTMFGREIEGRPGFYAGLEKYGPPDSLRERVRRFCRHGATVGNFMLLPNIPEGKMTMNLYRGSNHWRDFFDLFLIHLDRCLRDRPDRDEFLSRLVRNNDFFFRHFRGENGIRSFAEIGLLEDYLTPDGVLREIFSLNFHWKDETDRESYFHAAELYLDRATAIIAGRSGKIIGRLRLAF